jgi:hypothetical protein
MPPHATSVNCFTLSEKNVAEQLRFAILRCVRYGPSFDMIIVPEAANMPPTPWQTEILAPGI